MIDDYLKNLLIKHEGKRLKVYTDSVGKATIGVGRNLVDVGISDDECNILLGNDIARTKKDVQMFLPWVSSLNEARQIVIISMAFNMGIHGLLGFKNTLSLIQAGRYKEASDNMLQSKWATQVGKRANELAKIMETGELKEAVK